MATDMGMTGTAKRAAETKVAETGVAVMDVAKATEMKDTVAGVTAGTDA